MHSITRFGFPPQRAAAEREAAGRANRWVMCGLRLTGSAALGEFVSKCSSFRTELARRSTNQSGGGRGELVRDIVFFTFLHGQIQTVKVCWFVNPGFTPPRLLIIHRTERNSHVRSATAARRKIALAHGKRVNIHLDPCES